MPIWLQAYFPFEFKALAVWGQKNIKENPLLPSCSAGYRLAGQDIFIDTQGNTLLHLILYPSLSGAIL
jgi:hypothetical protein